MKTTELDNLAAETAAYMSTTHPGTYLQHTTEASQASQKTDLSADFFATFPGYGDLAARLAVSNLHKETSDVFSEVMEEEYSYVLPPGTPFFCFAFVR